MKKLIIIASLMSLFSCVPKVQQFNEDTRCTTIYYGNIGNGPFFDHPQDSSYREDKFAILNDDFDMAALQMTNCLSGTDTSIEIVSQSSTGAYSLSTVTIKKWYKVVE
jgi:hypothetical protein